jgi:sugar/nucleoside kinase (ribokinase family)
MHGLHLVGREELRKKTFDVICAGEALWKLDAGSSLRPGGGALHVALALANRGLRIGLATVLADDELGRRSCDRAAALGVDVGGVELARPRSSFVLVDASGGADQLPTSTEEEPPVEVPAGWSADVMLLSGLSPVLSHAAGLCKAARGARRKGALVVIDFNASLHAWAGRDPRTIHMVLREVDVARCSIADLAVLGMDIATVRSALRRSAVLVVCDPAGGAVATGPFGEVGVVPDEPLARAPGRSGDTFTAALCAELTRPGVPGESAAARWHRVLRRASVAR